MSTRLRGEVKPVNPDSWLALWFDPDSPIEISQSSVPVGDNYLCACHLTDTELTTLFSIITSYLQSPALPRVTRKDVETLYLKLFADKVNYGS
jgi:hypothetical protein